MSFLTLMEADGDELHASGKVLVVTGASRGIGKQVALTMAEEGANVAMFARDQETLDAARFAIVLETYGGHAQPYIAFPSLSLELRPRSTDVGLIGLIA